MMSMALQSLEYSSLQLSLSLSLCSFRILYTASKSFSWQLIFLLGCMVCLGTGVVKLGILIMSSKISVCNWWLQHRTLTLQSACPSLPAALFPVTAISVYHTIRFQEIHLSLQMTALTTIGICPRVPRFSLHKLTTRIARIPTKPKMSRKMLQLLLEMTVSLFHINNLN